jgi:hypothetical protein
MEVGAPLFVFMSLTVTSTASANLTPLQWEFPLPVRTAQPGGLSEEGIKPVPQCFSAGGWSSFQHNSADAAKETQKGILFPCSARGQDNKKAEHSSAFSMLLMFSSLPPR